MVPGKKTKKKSKTWGKKNQKLYYTLVIYLWQSMAIILQVCWPTYKRGVHLAGQWTWMLHCQIKNWNLQDEHNLKKPLVSAKWGLRCKNSDLSSNNGIEPMELIGAFEKVSCHQPTLWPWESMRIPILRGSSLVYRQKIGISYGIS